MNFDSSKLLEIIQAIVAQPTAPFREEAVAEEILRWLSKYPHVSVERDSFGNLLACYKRGDASASYAVAAHMDHPGFVDGQFLGSVGEAYRARDFPTRNFGSFAMWDLPPCELKEGRIYSRACDDLVGCATIVAMFEALERTEADCAIYGLFTRAEEVGFVGAIHLAKSGRLLGSVTVVSLETSSQLGGPAQMGGGVIVRVGDRSSIFDSSATAILTELARAKEIPYQRCLMSGGTCEATAYQLYGLRSAGLCVALGNYHNCGPDVQIDSEYVAINDVAAMTALCIAIAQLPPDVPRPEERLRAELERKAHELTRRHGP